MDCLPILESKAITDQLQLAPGANEMLHNSEFFNFEGSNDDNSTGISLEEAFHLGLDVFSYKFLQLQDSEKEAFINRLDSIK